MPQYVSNILTIQTVFLALALAAPASLAEPLAPVPNTPTTKVKYSALAILDTLANSLVLPPPIIS